MSTRVATRVVSRAATADLAIAAALWGGMYVVSAETFAAIPPATLGLLRLAIGVAALATFAALRGESLGWAKAPKGAVLRAGVAVAASILLQFAGTALTSAVEGSIVTMATPVFVLIFGWALEGIRVPRQAWFGIVLAAIGVGALALRSTGAEGLVTDASASRLLGITMLIGGGAAWALFSSLGRPIVAAVGARNAVTLSAGLAIPLMVPFVAAELTIGGIDLAAATTQARCSPCSISALGPHRSAGAAGTAAMRQQRRDSPLVCSSCSRSLPRRSALACSARRSTGAGAWRTLPARRRGDDLL